MPHVAAADNHAPMRRLDWQVQLFGQPAPALESWCRDAGVALDVLSLCEDAATAGVRRDAAYLVRPDGYIAVISKVGRPEPFAVGWRQA